MKIGMQEPDWADIGACMAHVDAEEQAKFFKSFMAELKRCCETHYRTEVQLLSIRDFLSKSDREYIATIGYEGSKT